MKRFGHKPIRPPDGATEIRFLHANGRWSARDDGPAYAVSYRDARGFSFGGYSGCTRACWDSIARRQSPCHRAVDETARRFGCANGVDLPAQRRR